MSKTLSKKQKRILDFIKSEIDKKGYPPSVREICDGVGLKSTSTVHGHLTRLEKKGYIRRDATKPRTIEILKEDCCDYPKSIDYPILEETKIQKEMIPVPIVGKVTAGQPVLAVENIEDTFPLPHDFLQASDTFILRVKGDSMINAGILDGDYIIVKQQPVAQNGDIVVALLDDEATVKRFYRERDHIRLQPENPNMDPIITKDVSIIGKVIGLLRRF
ncbi:MAG TPA: transcriptional repressor LexA [Clostridiales bacterium]|nr:transcriptional repressor LexA [Clostridiales bacterium]